MEVTAQEAVDFVSERAQLIFKQDKHHAPMVFAFGRKRNAVALLNKFDDVDFKPSAVFNAGWELADSVPYCAVFVSEAWLSATIPPEGASVSDLPNRQEVLQIIAQRFDGETQAMVIPFTRIGNEILFGEPIQSDTVKSYLFELFWKGVMKGLVEIEE